MIAYFIETAQYNKTLKINILISITEQEILKTLHTNISQTILIVTVMLHTVIACHQCSIRSKRIDHTTFKS